MCHEQAGWCEDFGPAPSVGAQQRQEYRPLKSLIDLAISGALGFLGLDLLSMSPCLHGAADGGGQHKVVFWDGGRLRWAPAWPLGFVVPWSDSGPCCACGLW